MLGARISGSSAVCANRRDVLVFCADVVTAHLLLNPSHHPPAWPSSNHTVCVCVMNEEEEFTGKQIFFFRRCVAASKAGVGLDARCR